MVSSGYVLLSQYCYIITSDKLVRIMIDISLTSPSDSLAQHRSAKQHVALGMRPRPDGPAEDPPSASIFGRRKNRSSGSLFKTALNRNQVKTAQKQDVFSSNSINYH